MRVDPQHAKKLDSAITVNDAGAPEVKIDVDYMDAIKDRLSLWEQGLLMKALIRSVRSRRRTPEQRALLALFVDQGGQ